MRIKRTIVRGQPGAKKWENKYGDKLICVRYRYDERENKKLTTVELVVEEKEWKKVNDKTAYNKNVKIQVMYGEYDIISLVRNAGGKWNRNEKVWELSYRNVLSLGLEDRMVGEN